MFLPIKPEVLPDYKIDQNSLENLAFLLKMSCWIWSNSDSFRFHIFINIFNTLPSSTRLFFPLQTEGCMV